VPPVPDNQAEAIAATDSGVAQFPNLFSPLAVGPLTLKNRIFVTGHMTMMVTGGVPSEAQAAYYAARARGGVAMIVTEAAAVHETGLRGGKVISAIDDACIPGYARIVEACADYGCPVLGQLFHPGREMTTAPDGSLLAAYAPSAVRSDRFHVVPRALPRALIREIVAGYSDAARRLQRAGLAGAEIVANMGYLPSQFLNPRTNRRDDDYGGSFENRLRFLREVIADIRDKCGGGAVLGLRISLDEASHDGMREEEVGEICCALDSDGTLDYFNLIGGSSSDAAGSLHIAPPMWVANAYLAPAAGRLKARLRAPVFLAGRINQPQEAERVLEQGQADLCGMTRATICDPEIANKARAGWLDDIRACIGCNQACIGHEQRGYPISCIQYPESGRELIYGSLPKAEAPRRVLVAGGGPAGLKAAAVASARGHDVTLYEAGARLGGQVLLAQELPGRAEFGGLAANLAREAERAGVRVVLSTAVDRGLIASEKPDAVVLATGARPYRPAIEGAEAAHVVEAWDVLRGEANVGSSVVVADWRADWVGLGVAEKLVRAGCRVRLCVNAAVPGESLQQYVRDHWAGVLHGLGVEVIPYARLFGADEDSVFFVHGASGAPLVVEDVDTLVLAQGAAPATELETELADYDGEVHVIGDCKAPRTAEEAVLEGLKAAAEV
jgi:2,4-dienoyl-CoA reductase-like NADH-dependent reductase (Old Yellow Enzyme family)/pyruvate/2-oxoglutarate dehydrogenase complex dihydrolipoamide dehydrogenase (E3) component